MLPPFDRPHAGFDLGVPLILDLHLFDERPDLAFDAADGPLDIAQGALDFARARGHGIHPGWISERSDIVTPYEIELAEALWSCSFLPASRDKRFCRNMAEIAKYSPDKELSLRQRHYMEIMAWRYRRQLPTKYVPPNKPLNLPPKIKAPKSKPASDGPANHAQPDQQRLHIDDQRSAGDL
jgi:hypothetical protein